MICLVRKYIVDLISMSRRIQPEHTTCPRQGQVWTRNIHAVNLSIIHRIQFCLNNEKLVLPNPDLAYAIILAWTERQLLI